MFSMMFENLVAMVWALFFSVTAVAVFTFPFVAWVETSRAVLRPLLCRMGPLRSGAQFRVTDLACLLAMMSVLGLLTTQLMATPIAPPAAAFFLAMLVLLGCIAWRCAVAWLTRTRVRGLVRRAVFQLIVVPTALFFPITFVTLSLLGLRLLSAMGHLSTLPLVVALASAALATMLLLGVSRRLAAWVALGANNDSARR